MQNLGWKIYSLRLQRGITQEKLGELLNVGKSTISNYESGTSFPERETLIRLSVIFEVSTDFLLKSCPLQETPHSNYYVSTKIPVFTDLIFAENAIDTSDFITLPADLDANFQYFAFKIPTDFVNIRKISKDDIAIGIKTRKIYDSDIAIGVLNKKKTVFGIFEKNSSDVILLHPHSTNPDFKTITIDIEKDSFVLWGKLIRAHVYL